MFLFSCFGETIGVVNSVICFVGFLVVVCFFFLRFVFGWNVRLWDLNGNIVWQYLFHHYPRGL